MTATPLNNPGPFQSGDRLIDGDELNKQLASPARSTQDGLIATGTTRATALSLQAAINNMATVAASTGVVLPNMNPGQSTIIFNGGASTLTVYAPGDDTCDGTPGSTGVALTAAARCAYYCVAVNKIISALLGAVSA